MKEGAHVLDRSFPRKTLVGRRARRRVPGRPRRIRGSLCGRGSGTDGGAEQYARAGHRRESGTRQDALGLARHVAGGSLSYAYRWVRCGLDGGRPDGGDCGFILGATRSNYELTGADVGFRMRVRVTATNADGSRTVASNPTAVRRRAAGEHLDPTRRRNAARGLGAHRSARSWTGRQPIRFSYGWLRCNTAGGECAAIAGANGRTYRLTSSDVSHSVRCNVTARNAIGSTAVLSSESGSRQRPSSAGSDQASERRGLHPGDERSERSPSGRRTGRVLAQPSHEPATVVRRPRPSDRHPRLCRA